MKEKKRCWWTDGASEILKEYHDNEWCIPVHDDKKIYENLVLETFTTGLSWEIILKKREAFREAFDGFDAEKIAQYDEAKIEKLCQNPAIVRSPRKIRATISNTKVFLEIQKEFGSFNNYIWGFSNNKVLKNTNDKYDEYLDIIETVAKDLKKRGIKYMGPSIATAFLESIGVLDNHETGCFMY